MSTWDRSQSKRAPGYAELFETVMMLVGVVADQEARIHRLENEKYDDSISRLAVGSLRSSASITAGRTARLGAESDKTEDARAD